MRTKCVDRMRKIIEIEHFARNYNIFGCALTCCFNDRQQLSKWHFKVNPSEHQLINVLAKECIFTSKTKSF